MRFLANENFPRTSVNHLRKISYDIASVIEDSPGATDAEVLARAASEERIVLTFDRDYGELIYRLGMPSPAGVVYFRYAPLTPEEPAQDLLRLLNMEGVSLEGRFTVVERTQVRQRPLP
jgi:predicted nuclease of predicted toxin-antitoxin system